MAALRVALVIALKDLRQRTRDRSALVLGFVAPLVIATLMSFAFAGTEDFHVDLAVADEDGGPVAQAFSGMLTSPELEDIVTVSSVASETEARDAVREGTADAAVVVPEGFSAAVHEAGPRTTVRVLSSVDSELAGQVARALTQSFTAQVDANQLSVAAALAAGAPPERAAELAAAAARERIPVELSERPVGAREMSVISYYGPAMGLFFVLFAVSFGARSFFEERVGGTLDRVVAAPVRPGAVLAGKAVSTFVYAVVSLTTMAVVTSLVFDADWGPAWAAAVLVVSFAVVVVALTALVISLSRTDRQADGLSSVVVFGLVLLGGNFFYVWSGPEALRTVALMTPNGWVLRAFTDLANGSGTSVVWASVLVCLAFASAAGGVAALLSRRAVQG